MMSDNPLIGTWRLERWRTIYDSGREIFPMGEDAQGWLLYTNDGHMAAFLSRADRPPFETGEMLSADDAEKVRAWDSFYSYSGRYEIGDGEVVHHLEACIYPNWVGKPQPRQMKLEGDRLTLSTPPQKTRRGEQWSEVVWRRAGAQRRP